MTQKPGVITRNGLFSAFFALVIGAGLAWIPIAVGLAFQKPSESAQDAQEDADQKLLEKWLIWMRPDFRPDAPPVLVDPEVVRDSRLKDRSRETAPALKLELPPLEKPTEDADPQD